MALTPDRHPGALIEDEEIRLVPNQAAPSVAGAFNYNGVNFVLRDSTGSFNPRTAMPGTSVRWVLEGGGYATLQAAVDAAADQEVLLVGPRDGGASWGAVVLPAGKRLAIVGLGGKQGEHIRIDSLTFAPSTGANILLNTAYVRGLFITGSFVGGQGVRFAGSAPARLRLQECYVYNSGASGNGVVSDNGGSGSSLYLDNCTVQSGVSTGIGVNHIRGYTAIRNGCEVSRWQYAVQCAAGNVEALNTLFDCTGIANEVVRITGGLVTVGYSTIKNTTANASGVNLTAAGASLGMGDATFAIGTGTGYCVRGVSGSYFLYGRITYSNSAAAPYNVKVQNTVSSVAVTQAFTSSP